MESDKIDTRNEIRKVVAKMRQDWNSWRTEIAAVRKVQEARKAVFVQEILDALNDDVFDCAQYQRRLPETETEQIIYDMMMCRRDVSAETEKAIKNAMKQAKTDGTDAIEEGFNACFTAAEQIMPVIFARLMLSNPKRLDEIANYLMSGWAATYLEPGKRVKAFLKGVSFKDSGTQRLYEELPGAVRLAYADLQQQPERRAAQLLKCVRDNIGYPSKPSKEIEAPRDKDNNLVEFEDPASLDPINLFLEKENINELIRNAKIKETTKEWCVLQSLLLNPYLAILSGSNIEIGEICNISAKNVAVVKVTLRKKFDKAEKALQEAV